MKKKLRRMMETLILVSLLFFAGETPVLASSTQVTFQVPIRVQGFTASTRSLEVYCSIGQPRHYVAWNSANPSEHFAGVSNWSGTVTVVVHADRGVIFHKGDVWFCSFRDARYIIGEYRPNPRLLAPTSVMIVRGHL